MDSKTAETYFHSCSTLRNALRDSDSLEELTTTFDQHVRAVGMGPFCLFEISSVNDSWRKQLVVGTFPSSFLDPFWAERRTMDSPFIRHARLYGRPFKAEDVINDPDLTRQERAAAEKTMSNGFSNAWIFPISGRFNRIALMVVIGDPGGMPVWQSDQLHFLSLTFYECACALQSDMEEDKITYRGGLLTHRERECLTWVANGKSDWDIATILGISKRTARFHVENAIKKLNASSRLQAVIIAIRNIEIFI